MSTDDDVRACLAGYDTWADRYDEIDNPLIAQADVALEARAASLAGARVLELGCGTGRNARACLAHGARRYVGVDGSAGMLAIARARHEDARITWLQADLVDGAAAATRDGAFDLALLCLVLEHVRDVAPVIAAAAAALAPAGRLLLLELHPALHARGVGANFRAGDREVRLPSYRHDAAELSTACADAGLGDVEILEHRPAAAALARSAKLARYTGEPVLLELAAARPAPRR